MIQVGKHEAYLATPSPAATSHKDVGILYLPDIIGIWQNSQLLADEFASSGYTTLIIDYFRGDAIPMNRLSEYDIADWVKNGRNGNGGHTPKEIDPIVKEALKYMKETLGFKRVGAVGYCFGAKYVLRHYENGIEVGFIAHPSFIDDEELASISGPLSIAAAETDSIFTKEERHKSEEILQKNGNVYQMFLYSGVVHGFAVRCSLEKKVERLAKAQALKQAVDFFDAWLD